MDFAKFATDLDLPRKGVDIVVLLVGWLGGRYFERRKTKREAALTACKALRIYLGTWYSAILSAVASESSAAQTLKKLRLFQEDEKFELGIRNCRDELVKRKDCAKLVRSLNVFSQQSYELKKQLDMALVDGKFKRDYEGHKKEAISYLRGVYKSVDEELSRTIQQLSS